MTREVAIAWAVGGLFALMILIVGLIEQVPT